jgi:sugar phosphate isomerase/epimerase
MKLPGALGQLTYCTNVHPGEGLADVKSALLQHAVRVKALVSPQAPFAVGLRLSARAASELEQAEELRALRALLTTHGLYVFTINGFPYGDFHGTRVKERVYLPDWRDDARISYSDRLARLLSQLLPEDQTIGSVSTVPGGFKLGLRERDAERMALQIVRHVAELVRIARETGKSVVLALEPEPACMLETVSETVSFFEHTLWSARSVAALAALLSVSEHEALRALQQHCGVCLDLCHAAVEYEDPNGCIDALEQAGIQIAKVQISAGLALDPRDPEARAALAGFREEVYLHQTVARQGSVLRRYVDMPEAEAGFAAGEQAQEWRVHFHVPIFHAELAPLSTTQAFIRAVLARHRSRPITAHLEVETYTWGVLPAALRDVPVHESVAREIAWASKELGR